jgi:hypothetical protein
MNRFDPRLGLGVLLILGGILFLLQNFNLIPSDLGWLWSIVFAVVGAGFLSVFVANRAVWWPLIPGLVLLDLAVLILLGELAPGFAGRWGGAVFLAGLSLPFWAIYLVSRINWWSLIPAGVLATLGAVAALGPEEQGAQSGGLFFLGLGLTFLIVWLAPTAGGRMRWAIWPAGVLLVMGALLTTPFGTPSNLVFPAALVLAGAFLLFRAFRPRAG